MTAQLGLGTSGSSAMDSAGLEEERRKRVALIFLLVFALFWLVTAVYPLHPRDWLLENVLTALAVPALIWMQRVRTFKPSTNLGLMVFLCLHSIGAHFTYAEVPYNQWAENLTGSSADEMFGWERNHFDRLVHLLYGALVLPASREILGRHVQASARVIDLICIQFIVATSTLYELLEWAAVMVVDKDLGMAYLGIQGDVWDAHKDILMATVGACLSSGVSGLIASPSSARTPPIS